MFSDLSLRAALEITHRRLAEIPGMKTAPPNLAGGDRAYCLKNITAVERRLRRKLPAAVRAIHEDILFGFFSWKLRDAGLEADLYVSSLDQVFGGPEHHKRGSPLKWTDDAWKGVIWFEDYMGDPDFPLRRSLRRIDHVPGADESMAVALDDSPAGHTLYRFNKDSIDALSLSYEQYFLARVHFVGLDWWHVQFVAEPERRRAMLRSLERHGEPYEARLRRGLELLAPDAIADMRGFD